MDDIVWPVNPALVIVVVMLGVQLAAALRGWGWKPLWFVLGGVVAMLVVGGLTAYAIVPDGVDIFAFLIASLINVGAGVYMLIKRPNSTAPTPKKS